MVRQPASILVLCPCLRRKCFALSLTAHIKSCSVYMLPWPHSSFDHPLIMHTPLHCSISYAISAWSLTCGIALVELPSFVF